MNPDCGRFVWYELLCTDIAAAANFYADVIGWSVRGVSNAGFPYSVLSAGGEPVCGLMDLPEEGRRKGATPRWVGYVAVDDANTAAASITRLGGAVYVPPTDTNIGRIAIVADPQAATLGLVEGPKVAGVRRRALDEPGTVGWHELLAADSGKALAFYAEVLGWHEAKREADQIESYRLFSAAGDTMGGMFNKLPRVPQPFWLYYFSVSELDRAIAAVRTGGGQVVQGPTELLKGVSFARCIDPQGAMFALRGPRGEGATEQAPDELGFAAEWGGFASRGRVVAAPKGPIAGPITGPTKAPAKPAPRPKR